MRSQRSRIIVPGVAIVIGLLALSAQGQGEFAIRVLVVVGGAVLLAAFVMGRLVRGRMAAESGPNEWRYIAFMNAADHHRFTGSTRFALAKEIPGHLTMAKSGAIEFLPAKADAAERVVIAPELIQAISIHRLAGLGKRSALLLTTSRGRANFRLLEAADFDDRVLSTPLRRCL